YPDRHQRAERIFYFVRDRVRYTSDSDQFKRGEYAQNADEMMAAIVDNGIAQGDCEDSSVLLAVMYKGAGYRSAMVLSPGHVATLVHLPKYQHAPRKLAIANESGWVWAEATGATNRFGWMPESANSQELVAREVAATQLNPKGNTKNLIRVENGVERNGGSTASWSGMTMFFGTTGILWLATSRRRVSKRL
ncbi:hypothetical protein M1N24_00150, partial [Dehalococcoidia bacterium]|nr:hypothetical protein [Dehalococcoidia bacterium]